MLAVRQAPRLILIGQKPQFHHHRRHTALVEHPQVLLLYTAASGGDQLARQRLLED